MLHPPVPAFMDTVRNRLLGPWRRLFQWLTSLTILLLPFGRWNGRSLLRIDIGSLSLELFGQTLRIEELYLFLFFTLAFGLFFLLVTLIFGRVWCGWACPQTTLSDVAEWLARRLGLKLVGNRLQGPLGRRLLAHLLYLLLALLVASNLLWYFIEPQRFFLEIARGELHPGAWLTLAVIALTIYLDFALIRRVMCHDFCPYGRFQTALADAGTLTLHLPESEAPRCIKCGACVRSCPMGIDIREGFQAACINCGRCLDACRQVMQKRKQPGLIGYSFGTEGRGPRALLNPRTLLLGCATLALSAILVTAVALRSEASLKLTLSHTASSRVLEDGQLATFFSAWVSNRSDSAHRYRILASDPASGEELPLRGQTSDIELAPGENRALSFVLTTAVPGGRQPVVFELRDERQRELASSRAEISPP